jgi:class 3 adenylate cyclase/tetratricopeptide (TPR) repeat protein
MPSPRGSAGDRADVLLAFLPRLALEWIAESPSERYRSVPGSMVFVDVSGFTKLSERLARHGKIGAEELAATIGGCFVELLAVAYDLGGGLVKFGGDALLLLFSGPGHEARAARAALAMRAELRRIGRLEVLGQRVTLRMSVGVHSGCFDFFLVGSSHRELVVTGPAASTTVTMESAAGAGEIVVSPATAAALQAGDVGVPRGGGFLLRRVSVAVTSSPAPAPVPQTAADVAQCIPVAIRPAASGTGMEPEHRRVTVAFVHFDGLDALLEGAGPGPTADALEALMGAAQRAADRHGVTFVGTDIDDDGGKVILVAGAPTSTGEDEDQMLLTLRELMDEDGVIPIRTGVNRGAVFAGEIGPSYRRTFTVMGDAVNLSARLMAKAQPGQIVCSPDVLARARASFRTSALEPFLVKGKAKAVEAVLVHERVIDVAPVTTTLPLVGREHEVHVLREAAELASQGRGSLVELVGEAGSGKSRLVEELLSMAGDMRLVWERCERYETSTPYRAFRRILRSLLRLDDSDAGDQGAVALRTELAATGSALLPWSPLVGAVAGIPMPDTAEISDLDVEFRAIRLREVVGDIFTRRLSTPTLLVFEDVHWMDEASSTLLASLCGHAGERPWLICVTRRPDHDGFVADPACALRLSLPSLTGADVTRLAHLALRDVALRPDQVEALSRRSGGNPLFLRELAAAAQQSGDFDSLPDSVDAVIASRIDRLTTDDRQLLRRVSVLGTAFDAALLDAVLDDVPASDDPVWRRLEGFLERDHEGGVTFSHGLIRDGAYDGLPYRLRRALHARAGDAIRERTPEGSPEPAALLSLHYLRAQRHGEAWRYAIAAAEKARDVYANTECVELYGRALEAARHLDDLTALERATVQEALGDAQYRASAFSDAKVAYSAARRLAGSAPLSQGRLQLKIARVLGRLDRYSGALRWITKGLRSIENEDGPESAPLRAQLLAWYGRFCQEQGRHDLAIRWSNAAVAEAEVAGDKEALANALKVIDWASMDLGTLDEPDNWRRALVLFADIGDLANQSTLLNGLGMHAYFQGRWVEALDYYRQSRDMAARAGNTVLVAFEDNNIAEIVLEQGRLDEAESLFTDVLRAWRGSGYRSGESSVKCNLGRVAAARSSYAEALELFDEAVRGASHLGGHAEVLEANTRKAECLLRMGDAGAALELAERSLEQGRALGGVPPQEAVLHRIRGEALSGAGDVEGAVDALRRSVASARARGADHELALTLLVVAAHGVVGVWAGDPARDAETILVRLGVRSRPPSSGARPPLSVG